MNADCTLARCLVDTDPLRLEVIARSWLEAEALNPLPERAELLAALRARMSDPETVQRVWDSLSPQEQEALARLLAVGGKTAWLTFLRRWGEVRPMGPGRMMRERPWESPISVAEALWYRGLVFRTVVEGPTGFYDAAVVPEELRALLPISPDSLLRLEPLPSPSSPPAPSDAFLDDFCTYLAYLQVYPQRALREEDGLEARLRPFLQDADPGRLRLIRHLVRRLGWLRQDRLGYLRLVPEPVTEWLKAPSPRQRLALAEAWRNDPTWNDLQEVPTLHLEKTGAWRNDPLLARNALLNHLKACRPGEWYSIAGFIAAVKEADPDFQRPDGNYNRWYIRSTVTGEYLSGFEHWDEVEGALIRYILAGPLAWFGLVALASADSGESCFALTPTGAAFLGIGEVPEEPLPPLSVVQPDLVVRVPAARRYERFQVSRVAEWVGIGEWYTYRLTPASLERARQQRIAPTRVAEFLEEITGGQALPALRAALKRWEARGPEARLEAGVLLRLQDEALLRDLAASAATRRYFLDVLTPTVAVVAPDGWEEIARALVARGVLPDVVGL